MTWSADDEYRTRVLSRRRTVLQLRHPGAAYGPAALAIMYAAGAVASLSGVAGFGASGADAAGLMLPAGVATALSALVVGTRLHGLQVSSAPALVGRVALIWALVGAAFAALTAMSGVAGGSFARLAQSLADAGMSMLAGGLVGALGGVAGGAAATFLCVERRR